MRTEAQWRALRAEIQPRGEAWIDGGYRPALSGETFPAIDPASETLLVEVASCDQADVDLAVAAARPGVSCR